VTVTSNHLDGLSSPHKKVRPIPRLYHKRGTRIGKKNLFIKDRVDLESGSIKYKNLG
jgi:hypothetical protein